MSTWYWVVWAIASAANLVMFAISIAALRRAERFYDDTTALIQGRQHHCGDPECTEAHP